MWKFSMLPFVCTYDTELNENIPMKILCNVVGNLPVFFFFFYVPYVRDLALVTGVIQSLCLINKVNNVGLTCYKEGRVYVLT